MQDALANKGARGGLLRKQEVLGLLKTKPHSIDDLVAATSMNNKNISSQLCYLKKDGVKIAINSEGKRFIEDYEYPEDDSSDESDSLEDEVNDDSSDESDSLEDED